MKYFNSCLKISDLLGGSKHALDNALLIRWNKTIYILGSFPLRFEQNKNCRKNSSLKFRIGLLNFLIWVMLTSGYILFLKPHKQYGFCVLHKMGTDQCVLSIWFLLFQYLGAELGNGGSLLPLFWEQNVARPLYQKESIQTYVSLYYFMETESKKQTVQILQDNFKNLEIAVIFFFNNMGFSKDWTLNFRGFSS